MAILAPLGTFLTQFDTAIMVAQTAAVGGLVTTVKAPIATMAVIYFMLMGWRVMCGDLERLNAFTFDMAKIGLIFWCATDLPTFNKYVVGVFELGFPTAITNAVTSGGVSTVDSGTVAGVGGAIDKVWYHLWGMAASCWDRASMLDVSSRLIAAAAAIIGGLGLVLIAGVYLVARFLLAIVVVLGPVCIACAMFAPTRPIFERWIGKGVSLIVLQIAAVIVMQVVLGGTITFMGNVDTTQDLPTQLQSMIAMCVWLLLGAFAVYSLPAIAYSIGTGVAISFAPIAAAGLAAATGAFGLLPNLRPAGGGDESSPTGDVNLSLARAELAGDSGSYSGDGTSGGGFAAAPPPPLLSPVSRKAIGGSSSGPLLLPPPSPLLTYDGA